MNAEASEDSIGPNQIGADAVPRRGVRQAVEALRDPVYRWWFGSQVLSASGGMTQMVAQSWLVLQLTHRPLDLGLLGAISFLPALVGGAWAGAVLDRVDKRRALMVTQTAFIVLSGGQAALLATGSLRLWMLYALAACTGVVTAFDNPARQVYVLELVGRERLVSAVSLYEVIMNASRVIGPALGGLLLATVGTSWCFAVNALTFVPPLYVLLRYRPANPAPPVRHDSHGGGALAGLRYAWRTPAIRSCVLLAVAAGMIFNLGVAVPVLATQTFHLGGGGYGLFTMAFGLGAIPGALVAAGAGQPTGPKVRLLAVVSGAIVLLTAASPVVPLAFVGLAWAGFASIWFIAVANTLVQLRAVPAMRGRIMGVWTMALPGSVPFTGLLTAAVCQGLGGRAGFGLAGLALALAALVTWRALAGRPLTTVDGTDRVPPPRRPTDDLAEAA